MSVLLLANDIFQSTPFTCSRAPFHPEAQLTFWKFLHPNPLQSNCQRFSLSTKASKVLAVPILVDKPTRKESLSSETTSAQRDAGFGRKPSWFFGYFFNEWNKGAVKKKRSFHSKCLYGSKRLCTLFDCIEWCTKRYPYIIQTYGIFSG